MSAIADMIGALSEVCAGLHDQRRGPRRDGDYTMADIGLAAFSIFFMGSPSFLGHQQALAEGTVGRTVSAVRHVGDPLRQLHPPDAGRRFACGIRRTVREGDRGSGATSTVPVS